ncbi:MAG: nucleoside deaminase [Candidatus Omnitrophica bacterium]|nr:nucleoside deaminase [Candidatus Omnitrophota bacterium]
MGTVQTKFMRLALKEARKNLTRMQGGPFGACIVRGNKVIAGARNTVLKNDPTAHAEINAIRLAARRLKSFDLSGCTIYSTTEPCPMCFSAIHWARIDKVIYGTSISDAKRIGFNELNISSALLKKIGRARVKIVKGALAGECRRLFKDWNKLENKVLY